MKDFTNHINLRKNQENLRSDNNEIIRMTRENKLRTERKPLTTEISSFDEK
jgi:hypothetical protein